MKVLFLSLPVLLILAALAAETWLWPRLRSRSDFKEDRREPYDWNGTTFEIRGGYLLLSSTDSGTEMFKIRLEDILVDALMDAAAVARANADRAAGLS